jgi:hypothetical protein
MKNELAVQVVAAVHKIPRVTAQLANLSTGDDRHPIDEAVDELERDDLVNEINR